MRVRVLLGVYVLLLIASHAWQWSRPPATPNPPVVISPEPVTPGVVRRAADVIVPAMDDRGIVTPVRPITVRVEEWAPERMAPLRPTEPGTLDTRRVFDTADEPPTVLLIHGSPGAGSDFSRLAPVIAAAGYRVLAPDLPGFGRSGDQPSLSTLAHARAVRAVLDTLGVGRVHALGWSMGGGVALHLIDLTRDDPEDGGRIASLTLLAAVGSQANEASGSHAFEQFKYAVGKAVFVHAIDAVPHFGLLGPRWFRLNTLRNFADTDFRAHDPILTSTRIPTLILHGRHDVLIPLRAAESHHAQMPTSALVVLNANHFIPFVEFREAADQLVPFFRRHDRPGADPIVTVTDLGGPPRGSAAVLARLEPWIAGPPWWLAAAALVGVMLVSPTLAVVLAAFLVDARFLDFAVAIVGLVLGWYAHTLGLTIFALARRAPPARLAGFSTVDWARRTARGPLAIARDAFASQFTAPERAEHAIGPALVRRGIVTTLLVRAPAATAHALVAFIPAWITLAVLMQPARTSLGSAGVALALLAAAAVARLVPALLTRRGRQHIRRRLARTAHHEYWPAWVFYPPLVPLLFPFVWANRRRGGFRVALLGPTAINPGIENGGGYVGESKSAIMHALARGVADRPELAAMVMPTLPIAPGPADKRLAALHAEAERAGLSFPLVLKPDVGQRGHAVKVVSDDTAALTYLAEVTETVIVQPFHPGPVEVGICWVRTPHAGRPAAPRPDAHSLAPPDPPSRTTSDPVGSIFSITAKDFPVLTGDGRRTLEEMIWAHPRFRNQAPVFLARHAADRSRVLAADESLALAKGGNHCQGTLFRDGAHLITPELSRAIDAIASSFAARGADAALDFGRFDIRCASEDDLRAARGLAIVELNGALGESTNLYDPARGFVWAYGVLCRQWRLMYHLGWQRQKSGVRAVTIPEIVMQARRQARARTGSALSD